MARHEHLVAGRRVPRGDDADDVRAAGDVERVIEGKLRGLDVVDLDDALLHIGRDFDLADLFCLIAKHVPGSREVLRAEAVRARERLLDGARRFDRAVKRRIDEPHVVEGDRRRNERVGALKLGQPPRQVPTIDQSKRPIETIRCLGPASVEGVGACGESRGEREDPGEKPGQDGGQEGPSHRKGLSVRRPRSCAVEERARPELEGA
jgi:hypothetical protein